MTVIIQIRLYWLEQLTEAGRAAVLPAVEAISKSSRYTRDYSRMKFFLGERESLLVAIRGSEVVGFCQVSHLKLKGYSSVYNVGVKDTARKLGVGRSIIQSVMAASPAKKIRLKCDVRNEEALAFYTKMGFVEVGRKTAKSGDQLVVLELNGTSVCPADGG
jgi:ribosomal protein S18 acetylase RimI-like enzyme